MSAVGERVQLFLGEHEREQADRSLPHGEVCVRSLRSPDKKTDNEDSAAIIQLGDDSLVLAVADGVGGSVAGREASNAAVRTLSRLLTKLPEATTQLRPAILDAVEAANKAVLNIARGAATTLVVAQLDATKLRSYHVGDSELLAVGQRGRIKQRVVPHSPTGFAVEAGLLDEDEAVQHEQRHVLFNVIGSAEMRVEVGPALQLAARDTVLLASDGLFDNLYIDEIVDTIRSGPLTEAADKLVARVQARMHGEDKASEPCKPDDLTVVLFRPHKPR
ncbi:MAG TPA: protein phosphatase 2C domain-containing protein [Gammaproteobacteria bacterium]|nr:protein phosphatase 2C domain-containing protein [Gammaproteobacteria bacterium]